LLTNLNKFIITQVFTASALALFLWGSSAYAQEPPAPAVKPQPAPRVTVSTKPQTQPPARHTPPPRTRTGSQGGGSSSFFFDDADVFEVIQTVFGEALRVNYIIDPSIKGRVNFRTTTPIPRDRILPVIEIILRLNGIAVVEEAGLYRIIPIGNISKEPAPIRFGKAPDTVELKGVALMQIVPLTFISSTEMAAILTPLLTQGGAIHDISKRNMLIVADTDSNVRRLLQVIEKFDVDPKTSTNQPRIYVYAVQNSKAKAVADILNYVMLGGAAPTTSTSTSSTTSSVKSTIGTSTTTGTAGGQPTTLTLPTPRAGAVSTPRAAGSGPSGDTLVAPTTKIFPDEANNTLVILASPGDYSVILSAIKQIDIIPRQVMIEALVASVTLDDNLTFGLKWSARANANIQSIGPLSTNPQTLLGTLGFQNINAFSASTFGYQLTDKMGGVRLQIEALAANDKAKVLSAPQLLVADNKEAKIQVGSQIPLATSTTSTPLATTTVSTVNTTTSTIQYKDIGTILTIKPQINDSGLVTLEISQEVSGAETKNVLGTDQYVITKNEVKTNLVVQDGETILIGGLVFETLTQNSDGIPILNKIPILNFLSGSTKDDKKRQELVILLTPRVVRSPSDAKRLTNAYSERFRNVEREINMEKFLQTFPGRQNGPNGGPGKPGANGAVMIPEPAQATVPQQVAPGAATQAPAVAPSRTPPPVIKRAPAPDVAPSPMPTPQPAAAPQQKPVKPAVQPPPVSTPGPAAKPANAPMRQPVKPAASARQGRQKPAVQSPAVPTPAPAPTATPANAPKPVPAPVPSPKPAASPAQSPVVPPPPAQNPAGVP
jgi:general secretion pathway protein D